MKFTNNYLYVLLLFVVLSSCKDEESLPMESEPASEVTSLLSFLDSIPEGRYFESDLFSEIDLDIYGAWKLDSTSGTIAGSGAELDFDYLLLKPNSIFGILKDSTLLTTGYVEILSNSDDAVIVNFVSEIETDLLDLNLMRESSRAILFTADSLHLMTYSPDGFNDHLVREE